jgi:hypothetical protein
MRVVHCKKEKYTVYIGRPSILGNPFAIGKDGTREEVIKKYEDWLRSCIVSSTKYANAIYQLKEDDILGCWCAPKACHGDVIIMLWKEMHGKT